jgi:UDP-N-acetylmuramoyl-L-alanyl-D-glutamate--2,6-diaminopimelate ligase
MANIRSIIRQKLPVALSAYHFLWAWSAAKLRRHPSKKIFVIGVTGTKGKTTTLELINAILEAAGKKTAISSSLRVKIGDQSQKNWTGNTMPGRGFIQKFLTRAVAAQCGYALIEVSSEGVVAHRHKFVDWNFGVLTNLAPEHIESHGSFEKYRAAKLEFLEYVLTCGGKVFLNEDDPHFPFFSEALVNAQTFPFSMRGDVLERYLPKESASRAAAGAPFVPRGLEGLPVAAKFLLSDFNKSNIACAVAVAKELGVGEPVIQDAISNFKGVPGRLNILTVGGYTAVVDYAHTPESLEAAYQAVKPKSGGRLLCILGACGGGRDMWKRPEFGKIAAQNCDEIFLTEEDPYNEKPEDIVAQIRSGVMAMNFPTNHVHDVPSRREAIAQAVAMMREGDVVIGTGKGSEDWIHYANGKKVPWNEKEEFERALLAKKGNAESLSLTPESSSGDSSETTASEASDGDMDSSSPLDLPWV